LEENFRRDEIVSKTGNRDREEEIEQKYRKTKLDEKETREE
jgi:hypothetical protein